MGRTKNKNFAKYKTEIERKKKEMMKKEKEMAEI